jgi:uncharacterized NAD(P)/FAD-binding protein YdhS
MTQSVQSRRPRKRVLIIGGGASGVLLSCHLLRDPSRNLTVTLVERRAEVGRGVAYFTADPNHLLNVRAANMSAFPDQPDHFWRWLCARAKNESLHYRCADPFCFVPRNIYGEYIRSLLNAFLSEGGPNDPLHIIRGECVSIRQVEAGVTITLADGSSARGEIAVLATGHDASALCDNYCIDPWTAPAEVGITPDSRILILGTGLTMVDYVLSLVLGGHRAPIIAMSRHGLLPQGHRPAKPCPIDRDTVPFGASAVDLCRWLRGTIDAHVAQGGDWRSIVDGIRPLSQQIWQSSSVPARRSFLEHARSWWDAYRHRMAPEVENRINGAIASSRLTVLAAKLSGIEPGATSAVVRYRRRGQSAIETIEADKIVDCRYIGRVPLKVTNPAVRSLFDTGLARLDPLSIGIDVTPECAVIDSSGVPSERLFAVGPLTRAAFWEIVAVPDIRIQCAALANHLASALAG